MKLKISDAISALSLVVTALVGFVTIKSGYDLWESGSIPAKVVEYQILSAQDPLEDFPDEKRDLSVQIRSGNVTLSRIWAVQTYLTNKGKSPILPSDIYEPFTVNVDRPWRIVAVSNNSFLSKFAVKSKWKKESDQSYSVIPGLINPNDFLSATVYLTLHDGEKIEKDRQPELTWTARISNLSSIKKKDDSSLNKMPDGPNISVIHEGWSVIFLIVSFAILFSLSTLLILDRNLFTVKDAKFCAFLVAVAVVNLCGSEAFATLLFPDRLSYLRGFNIEMNLPIILINIGLFFFLYRRKPVIG